MVYDTSSLDIMQKASVPYYLNEAVLKPVTDCENHLRFHYNKHFVVSIPLHPPIGVLFLKTYWYGNCTTYPNWFHTYHSRLYGMPLVSGVVYCTTLTSVDIPLMPSIGISINAIICGRVYHLYQLWQIMPLKLYGYTTHTTYW